MVKKHLRVYNICLPKKLESSKQNRKQNSTCVRINKRKIIITYISKEEYNKEGAPEGSIEGQRERHSR
jgi:hypothetical protein